MKISWIEPQRLAASYIPLGASDIQSLQAQGIRAILSLTEQPLTALREITPDLLTGLDLTYFHIPIPDQYPPTREQAQQILGIVAQMEAQARPLLVHCHAGIGRTGTILHLYYIAQGRSFEEAQAEIRAKRKQCLLLSDVQQEFVQSYRLWV